MNIDQKTAKINMFFGRRLGVVLGWVLGWFWEAKNLDFGSFFEEKSKAKKHDVLEGPKKPSSRGKKQSPEDFGKFGEARVEVVLAKLPAGGVGGVQPKNNILII